MNLPYELSGCMHVHSRYSDGSGSIKAIAQAAQAEKLDFLIISDHDTLRAKPEEGYYGRCLILVGEEISPFRNHLLAVNTKRHVSHHFHENAQDYIDVVREQGGLAFITHPFGESRLNLLFQKVNIHKWEDWNTEGLTGIEIWSYMIDWIEDVRIWNLLGAIRKPDRRITGPSRELLEKWDNIGKTERCVGIGSLDAHAKNLIPFVPLIQVFPYKQMFATIRTHVLSEKPLEGRDVEADAKLLYEALSEGRCYMANHRLGNPTGFRFWLEAQDEIYPMGSEIKSPFDDSFTLVSKLPFDATVRLLRSGEEISSARGRELRHRVEQKGVYRVEVSQTGKPWIFSNPIYVR